MSRGSGEHNLLQIFSPNCELRLFEPAFTIEFSIFLEMDQEIGFQNFAKALTFGNKIFNPFVSVGTKRELTSL